MFLFGWPSLQCNCYSAFCCKRGQWNHVRIIYVFVFSLDIICELILDFLDLSLSIYWLPLLAHWLDMWISSKIRSDSIPQIRVYFGCLVSCLNYDPSLYVDSSVYIAFGEWSLVGLRHLWLVSFSVYDQNSPITCI